MAGVWEVIAFISRTILTKHQNQTTYNTIFTLFLLLAPLWLNAFLYMTLGRMVWFFDETRKLTKLSAQRFGTLFVCLDIFSFIVQVVGAVPIALPKSSHDTQLLGLHIYMAGIGLQQFFILCFTGLMITLHRRLIQQERRGVLLDRLQNGSLRWRWLFYGIYCVLLMITVSIHQPHCLRVLGYFMFLINETYLLDSYYLSPCRLWSCWRGKEWHDHFSRSLRVRA